MSAQHSYWRLLVVVHWNSSAEFLPVNFAVWLSAQDLKDCQQLHFVFWVFKPTSKKCAFDREMQCTRKEEMLHIPLPRSLNFRHCCWPQISARRTPRSHCLKIQQMVNCMKAWTPSLPYFTCNLELWLLENPLALSFSSTVIISLRFIGPQPMERGDLKEVIQYILLQSWQSRKRHTRMNDEYEPSFH